jgi:hypothetical protein
MDWRLIAALSAAGGSFCVVAAGAYAVLTANPAPQRRSAPAPVLLSEFQFPAATSPSLGSPQASAPSPFAPESATALRVPVVAANSAGPSGRRTSGAVPAGNPPRIVDDTNKATNARPEPRHEPRVTGTKTASLTPFDTGARPEPPPRPVIEVKRNTVVPEINTAIPTARYHGVLTSSEVARIRHNLRLTPDQEPAWRPVESALTEMGRQQIAQLRRGEEPRISQTEWSSGRLYSIAGPLLQTLRPDQKETVRRLCRSLGFDNVASML